MLFLYINSFITQTESEVVENPDRFLNHFPHFLQFLLPAVPVKAGTDCARRYIATLQEKIHSAGLKEIDIGLKHYNERAGKKYLLQGY